MYLVCKHWCYSISSAALANAVNLEAGLSAWLTNGRQGRDYETCLKTLAVQKVKLAYYLLNTVQYTLYPADYFCFLAQKLHTSPVRTLPTL